MREPGRRLVSLASSGALLAGLLTGVVLVSVPAQVASAADDRETGCDEKYDSAVVGNTPIMFQRIVNHIPQGVAVSTLTRGTGTTPSRVVTAPRPVWLGQKTPYLNGGDTLDYKKWNQRGSEGWPADNWWDSSYTRHHVGCATNYPFLIGPGEGEKARRLNYSGQLFGRNAEWRGKASWWGVPKRYEQDYVGGFSTWTCRGAVDVPADADLRTWTTDTVYWKLVSQGSGFFGDNDSDRVKLDAGRAPKCENSVFRDMSVVPYFLQTYYGSLPSDVRTSNRCDASSTGNVVGCWQQIYHGPWNRSWRTETHVFAASLLATVKSTTTIEIPDAYRAPGDPKTRRVSWAVNRASITGRWPDGASDLGDARVPAAGQTSKYTVPGGIAGTEQEFKVGGWASTTTGEKKLIFRLTASTDGTWNWPTCQDETQCVLGDELQRPSVDLNFGYTLDSFDKLESSCQGDGLWRTSKFYTESAPCTIGTVPTAFRVSTDSRQNERRQPVVDDKGNPISTVSFDHKVVAAGDWMTSDLKVQSVRTDPPGGEGGGYVGANVRWEIQLAGRITNLT
ncbi:MAG: hypothetical protein ACR2KE_03450 [Candidatus Nanopelagicales bacterium]